MIRVISLALVSRTSHLMDNRSQPTAFSISSHVTTFCISQLKFFSFVLVSK